MKIDDIAKKFNVNISTVSKALNGSTDIAEKTRKAICEYAESIGYQTRRSKAPKGRIGVLWECADVDDPTVKAIAAAFRREAESENYVIDEQRINYDFDWNHPEDAASTYVGVFLLGASFNTIIERRLNFTTIPVVLMETQRSESNLVSSVKSDDLLAMSKAVDTLVSLDHNLIAFLGTDNDSLSGAERFAGYFFGLTKNTLPYRYDLTYFGDSSVQTGRNAAEYFLSFNKYFTAIICTSEPAARGFAEYMERAGRRIPEDISLICFGDATVSEGVPFTTIRPNCSAIGKQAFTALKASMQQGLPAQHVTVPCTLDNPNATCTRKKKFFPPASD